MEPSQQPRSSHGRRGFLNRILAASGLPAPAAPAAQSKSGAPADERLLPAYARAQNYRALKQSSFDRTGGNKDFWNIPPGQSLEIFKADQPGVITHIWFTIAAGSPNHLKELVLRGYW